MSNFYCGKCGTVIIDSPTGYVTGCEHYPIEEKKVKDIVERLRESENAPARMSGLLVEAADTIESLRRALDLPQDSTALHQYGAKLLRSTLLDNINS